MTTTETQTLYLCTDHASVTDVGPRQRIEVVESAECETCGPVRLGVWWPESGVVAVVDSTWEYIAETAVTPVDDPWDDPSSARSVYAALAGLGWEPVRHTDWMPNVGDGEGWCIRIERAE
jgi:hypothetical protein